MTQPSGSPSNSGAYTVCVRMPFRRRVDIRNIPFDYQQEVPKVERLRLLYFQRPKEAVPLRHRIRKNLSVSALRLSQKERGSSWLPATAGDWGHPSQGIPRAKRLRKGLERADFPRWKPRQLVIRRACNQRDSQANHLPRGSGSRSLGGSVLLKGCRNRPGRKGDVRAKRPKHSPPVGFSCSPSFSSVSSVRVSGGLESVRLAKWILPNQVLRASEGHPSSRWTSL